MDTSSDYIPQEEYNPPGDYKDLCEHGLDHGRECIPCKNRRDENADGMVILLDSLLKVVSVYGFNSETLDYANNFINAYRAQTEALISPSKEVTEKAVLIARNINIKCDLNLTEHGRSFKRIVDCIIKGW